jgi:hypothetical protein
VLNGAILFSNEITVFVIVTGKTFTHKYLTLAIYGDCILRNHFSGYLTCRKCVMRIRIFLCIFIQAGLVLCQGYIPENFLQVKIGQIEHKIPT